MFNNFISVQSRKLRYQVVTSVLRVTFLYPHSSVAWKKSWEEKGRLGSVGFCVTLLIHPPFCFLLWRRTR
jgi:hypothetical protein